MINRCALRDGRGQKSITLFFVTLSIAVLIVKFLAGGMQTPWGVAPVIGGTEFGLAVTGLLAAWVAREHTEKTKVQANGG